VVRDRLLVGFEEGTPLEVVDAALARAGVESVQRVGRIGVRSVRVSPRRQAEALAALRSAVGVEYAEPEVLLLQPFVILNGLQKGLITESVVAELQDETAVPVAGAWPNDFEPPT
jgi:hypothetical protein